MVKEVTTVSFVKKGNISESLEDLLSSVDKDRTATTFVSSFDPSIIVECSRRLFYKTTTKYISNLSYFESQTQFTLVDKWVTYLNKCKQIRVVKQNLSVADGNYNLHGYLPLVVEFKDLFQGVQIKGVNDETFKRITKKGVEKKDVIELMVYIWLLEIPYGLLIYENLNDQNYIIFEIIGYKPIIESVKKKCLKIIDCQLVGIPPGRPYKNTTKECKQCEFLTTCWKDKNHE